MRDQDIDIPGFRGDTEDFRVKMGDFEIEANTEDNKYEFELGESRNKFHYENAHGGDKLTSQQKLDQYMMYGIDNMGATANDAPECGPGTGDCGAHFHNEGGPSCCTHVVMTDGGSGK